MASSRTAANLALPLVGEPSALTVRSGLIGIVVVAFAMRLFAMTVFPSPEMVSDSLMYEGLAWRVAQGLGYTSFTGVPTAFFPPLYSMVIGGLYRVVGRHPDAVRIAQALISALVCLAAYDVARTLSGRRALALTAAALVAMDASLVLYPRMILSEGLFLPLLALAMVAWARAWRGDHLAWWAAFGGAVGVAALTRPPIQFLPLVAFGLWPWSPGKTGFSRRRWLAVVVVVSAAYMIAVAPWVWRNTHLRGTFTTALTSSSGTGLYISFFPLDGWKFGRVEVDDPVWVEGQRIKSEGTLEAEFKRSDYLSREVTARLRAEPLRPLLLAPLKLGYLMWPYDWNLFNGTGRLDVTYVFLLPFVGLGFLACRRARQLRALAPLWALLLYTATISVIFLGAPRFRMPLQPYIAVFAAWGLIAVVEARARWPVWLGGWAAAIGVFLGVEPTLREMLVGLVRRSAGG